MLRHVISRHPPDPYRLAVVAVTAALLVAGCGATGSAIPTPGSTSSIAAASGSPTTTSAPGPSASKGPATARFTLVGTAGLTGPVSTKELVCGEPSLDGPQIFFQGQAGTTGPMVVLFLRAGYVELRVATGAADTLRLRSFTGSGVTAFDASVGAQLDSPLTETTGTATPTTGIGAVTSIKGTIDCGDEQPGTANLVVTGSSDLGPVAGPLSSIHVTCTVQGSDTFVTTTGLTMAGSTPVLLFVNAHTASLQVIMETRSSGIVYAATGASLVSLVENGAHLAGDLPESVATGATPSANVLHVAGDVTCRTTT